MCHSDDSRPPSAPGAGTAAETGPTTLHAGDGNTLLAFEARAGQPTGTGIVVLPDVRGLHAFYQQLAVRFAEVGVDAVAIDYFGRTAGDDDRTEAFEFWPHVEKTTPAGVQADVQAAVDRLRERGATKVFTVGFCFGGGYSWRQSADTVGLAGCIGFYGRPATALEVVQDMTAPLLMLVAGADQHITVESVREVADRATVEADLLVFEGAPHSFFDRSADEHADAAAQAWTAIRRFLEDQSSRAVPGTST